MPQAVCLWFWLCEVSAQQSSGANDMMRHLCPLRCTVQTEVGFYFESYLKSLTTEGMMALQTHDPRTTPVDLQPLLALTNDGEDNIDDWYLIE